MPVLLCDASAMWLSLVFAAAAVAKFQSFGAWPGVLQNFRLLPRALVVPVAWLLPPLELAVAIGLMVAGFRSPAAIIAALLLMLFSAAVAINLRRGRTRIDCGCFSSDLRQALSPALLVRNAALLVAALCLVAPGADLARPALEIFIAAGGALCLFFCYLSVGLIA